jgi:predicted transcriptional regulator
MTMASKMRPDMLASLARVIVVAGGVTQAQAAKALGLTQTGISDIETNDRGLELIVVRDLVMAYGGDWLEFVAEL